jgi:LEA14-like dessication related protein
VISFRQYLSLLGGLSLLLFVLSGCAGFGKRLESPRITLANIKVQETNVLETVFQIEIRVFNTNEVALEVKGIECDIELNGKRFATGISKAETTIPSYETTLIPMRMYSSVLDIVMGLKGLSDTAKLKYSITGKLRLGKGAVPAVVPFKSHGELPLEGLLVPNNS